MESFAAQLAVTAGAVAPWEAVGRLALASALGALIGMEREYHGRSAGFRTQLLVALGSGLAMLVSLHFADVYGASGIAGVSVDPARVAYGVMGGIGFLGAGAIIQQGAGVRGLTTAASLWCTAAMGLACGFGMYGLSIFSTGMVIFALLVLGRLEPLLPARVGKTVSVTLPSAQQDNLAMVKAAFARPGIRVSEVSFVRDAQAGADTVTLRVATVSRTATAELIGLALSLPGVRQASVV